jgi:hypothetical protein
MVSSSTSDAGRGGDDFRVPLVRALTIISSSNSLKSTPDGECTVLAGSLSSLSTSPSPIETLRPFECLGDGLLAVAAATTVAGLAAAITGDFPFTVLVECICGDGAWSLVTEAESDGVAVVVAVAAAAATTADDGSGDCGIVGVAARGSEGEGAAAAGGSVAIAIALSGTAGLLTSTAIGRVEVESGVGA